jgi:hypothetical protein
MFTSPSMLTLVGALVGAGAYAPEPPADAAAGPLLPPQVAAEIRRARVEIYCGHNAAALAGIRTASRQLRAGGGAMPARTLAALDQAAWLARHNRHAAAELALEDALNQLPAADRAANGPA